jgi:hypothetical protein
MIQTLVKTSIARLVIPGTKSVWCQPWLLLPWVPAWWNATSPWTGQCGVRIKAPLLNRRIATLCKYIRVTEKSLGDGVKKVYDSEQSSLKKLRRISQ